MSSFGGKEIAYSFRARTHAEMLGWWGEMDKLSRYTKAPIADPSAPNQHANRVSYAVTNVGIVPPVIEASAPTRDLAPALGSSNPTPIAAAHSRVAVPTEVERNSISSVEATEEEEDSEEEGGSSAEEEEELARNARDLASASTSAPLVFSGQTQGAESVPESLPIYTGTGVTVSLPGIGQVRALLTFICCSQKAEKEALQEKAPVGQAGLLGSFFGASAPSGSSTSS